MGEQPLDLLPLAARGGIGVGGRDIASHVASALVDRAEDLARRRPGAAAWLESAGVAVALAGAVAHEAFVVDAVAWLSEGSALGYEFVELRTIDDFIAESDTMDNCLDSFSEKLESGVSYVFSIRRNGSPVADIEIGVHPVEPTMPSIVQLRGPKNKRAHPEIWRAAYSWLGSQELPPVPPQVVNSAARRRAWRALWKPYLE